MVANGILVTGMPLIAMFFLAPADFGAFSVFLLIQGVSGAIVLSTVAEPWARHAREISITLSSMRDYYAILSLPSSLSGCITALAAYGITGSLSLSLLAALGAAAGTYRVGARFRLLFDGSAKRAFCGDAIGVAIATVFIALLVWQGIDVSLETVVSLWAVALLSSFLATFRPALPTIAIIRAWNTTYKRDIRVLLADTAITDISGAGSQFLMAPVLGLGGFGTYRAAFNLVAPVRLVIAPLRPVIGSKKPGHFHSLKMTATVLSLMVVSGVMIWQFLELSSRLDIAMGTFGELKDYSVLVSLLFSGSVGLHLYSAIARVHSSPRQILISRAAQACFYGFGPLFAAVLFGLNGALIVAGASALVLSLVWYAVCRPARSS